MWHDPFDCQVPSSQQISNVVIGKVILQFLQLFLGRKAGLYETSYLQKMVVILSLKKARNNGIQCRFWMPQRFTCQTERWKAEESFSVVCGRAAREFEGNSSIAMYKRLLRSTRVWIIFWDLGLEAVNQIRPSPCSASLRQELSLWGHGVVFWNCNSYFFGTLKPWIVVSG